MECRSFLLSNYSIPYLFTHIISFFNMGSISSDLQSRSWTKDDYLISTDYSLIPIQPLNDIFDSSEFYWGRSMPEPAILEMLQNSLCFGLYQLLPGSGSDGQAQPKTSSDDSPSGSQHAKSRFVGFARCITDYTTFLYLTDVWVGPEDQGKGLGKWLINCIQSVIEELPYLRRSILFTGDWARSVPFYEKLMDMTVIECQKGVGLALMERKGPGHPNYGRMGNSYD
ncbi:hypothetical protein BX600DRAFT_474783 [Xylariales sp. PMI_506]|nr:hypothetical protein BX600DRAFT_474783 [Xylariales sp. PMI_506]